MYYIQTKKRSQRFQKERSSVLLYKKINTLKCQALQNGYKDELLPLGICAWDPWKLQMCTYSVLIIIHYSFLINSTSCIRKRLLGLRYPDTLPVEWIFHLEMLKEEWVTWQVSPGNLHRRNSLNSNREGKVQYLFAKLQPWVTTTAQWNDQWD